MKTDARTHHSRTWQTARRQRVAVATDGSYWGTVALRRAAEHAWLAGAELEVHTPAADSGPSTLSVDSELGAFPLPRLLVRADPDPLRALIGASERADLVVLGCRGARHHGLGLGAAVLSVASTAQCDVLVVGGRPNVTHETHEQISVLLGTGADKAALRASAALADLHQAQLTIVRAVPMSGHRQVVGQRATQAAMLAEAAAWVRTQTPSVNLRTDLLPTNPHDVIAQLTTADVLVIGVFGRLDPVATAALYHARTPVLLARG